MGGDYISLSLPQSSRVSKRGPCKLSRRYINLINQSHRFESLGDKKKHDTWHNSWHYYFEAYTHLADDISNFIIITEIYCIKSVLVWTIVWCMSSDKSLPDPTLILIFDNIWRHKDALNELPLSFQPQFCHQKQWGVTKIISSYNQIYLSKSIFFLHNIM